jgi:plasmid stabilization system protein ParE
MRLVLHRRVRSDVDEIMDYYERAEHPELTQDFYGELRAFMLDTAVDQADTTSSKAG